MYIKFVHPSRCYADIVVSRDTLESRQIQMVTFRLGPMLVHQNKTHRVGL